MELGAGPQGGWGQWTAKLQLGACVLLPAGGNLGLGPMHWTWDSSELTSAGGWPSNRPTQPAWPEEASWASRSLAEAALGL